jgi:tyrosyl-tRNA synthetase
MTLMPLLHLNLRGHNIIPLVHNSTLLLTFQIGGFTCTIGDPSGRLSDREKVSGEQTAANISKITKQVQSIFQNARIYAESRGYKGIFGQMEILNNDAWWKDLKFSDFLMKIAQFMRLGPMLSRERLVDPFSL